MYAQPLIHDLARALGEERVARSLEAYGVSGRRSAGCPLERLARWIVSYRRTSLDPALLAR